MLQTCIDQAKATNLLMTPQTKLGFWDAIVQTHKSLTTSASVPEPTIIIAGSESAGKSTLMSSFIYKCKPSDVKPTIGIDYKFIRTNSSTEGASQSKTVHHFWEIGGNRQMASTLPAILSSETAILVVVDLSRPGSIIGDLLYWLPYIRTTATNAGKDQPQIVVVANKYDLMPAGINSDLVFRTIRAVALCYEAAVICHSIDHRVLHQYYRNGISRFLTKREIVAGPAQLDSVKPVVVPVGSDSLESIGLPPGLSSSPDACKSWTQAFERVFGREEAVVAPVQNDAHLEPEPLIDTLL